MQLKLVRIYFLSKSKIPFKSQFQFKKSKDQSWIGMSNTVKSFLRVQDQRLIRGTNHKIISFLDKKKIRKSGGASLSC
jgi:hypothetical protein